MIAQGGAPAAAADADAAVLPEGEPGRSAGAVPGAAARRRCRCPTVDEYAETTIAQRISMVSGVAQVNVFGVAEVRGADRRRSAASWPRTAIGIDEVATADRRTPTSTCRPARCTAPTSTFTVQAERPAAARGRVYGPIDHRLPQRQPGAPRRGRARLRRRRERQERRAGSTATAHDLSRDPEAAGHQHRRGGRRGQGAAADASARSCRRRSRSTSAATAPVAIRESVARREVHAAAHRRPGRAGDLPLPAQRLGDDHPQPGAAGLDRRHLRGDVSARLQPRQPVADGAHALGRLRRRRRDRDAGEHRPAHGDGQEADAGGVRRLEGDRASRSSR